MGPQPRRAFVAKAHRHRWGESPARTELAQLIGEPQQNVGYWEQSEKPPRSDVLPKLAQVLGVRVEALLGEELPRFRRSGPVGMV